MESLSALAENPAIRTLFGPPVALDDPGGFTVWRTGTFLAVLAGTWAALTATRLTRGEEEAGRWDLLLAGRVTLRSLVGRTLAVLLCAAAVPGVAVGIAMVTDRHGGHRVGRLRGGDRRGGHDRRGPRRPRRAAAPGAAGGLRPGHRSCSSAACWHAWSPTASPPGLAALAHAVRADRPGGAVRGEPRPPTGRAGGPGGALRRRWPPRSPPGRDVGSGRLRGRDRGRAPSRLLARCPASRCTAPAGRRSPGGRAWRPTSC